jgi:hypothetical protein
MWEEGTVAGRAGQWLGSISKTAQQLQKSLHPRKITEDRGKYTRGE